jgi:beta-glucosidase
VPRWFDNDGGFGNAETFTTWWPRWVERVAERFGDLVGGWVPFACIPAEADQPWIDTWGILAGGPPVAAAVDLRDRAGTVDSYVDRANLLGAVLTGDWDRNDQVGAAELSRSADRWGGEVREAAEAIGTPLIISGFSADHDDADIAGEIIGALRSVIDDAVADGVPIEVVFVEPGIAGPESTAGLLDADRAPTPTSSTLFD